jgi:biopolymer transport protein ExbB
MAQLTRVLLMTVLLMMFVGAALAVAQEGGAPVNPAPARMPVLEAAEAEPESLMNVILATGATGISFMVVLALFSFVGATIAIERAFALRNSAIVPASFCRKLKPLLAGEPSPEVLKPLCAETTGPMPAILEAGLLRVGRPLVEVEKAMEDAAVREMSEIRGRIRPLNVIGNIAPLVGLLGTVVGMIIAFRTASTQGLGKGELMAEGIYMALLTTAGGLSIAIPALMFAAFFNSKVEKQFRAIDRHLLPAIPFFTKAGAAIASVPSNGSGTAVTETKPTPVPVEEPVPA